MPKMRIPFTVSRESGELVHMTFYERLAVAFWQLVRLDLESANTTQRAAALAFVDSAFFDEWAWNTLGLDPDAARRTFWLATGYSLIDHQARLVAALQATNDAAEALTAATIRAARASLGLSQADLAALAGVSRASVYRLETNRRTVNPVAARRLGLALTQSDPAASVPAVAD